MLRIALVHHTEHPRPVLRVIAARARIDRKHRRLLIVTADKKLLQFELAEFALDLMERIFIERLLERINTCANLAPLRDDVVQFAEFADLRVGVLAIVPKTSGGHLRFKFRDPFLFRSEVKDARPAGELRCPIQLTGLCNPLLGLFVFRL